MDLGLNTEFKHVRIRVHKNLLQKFLSAIPKGFDVTVYPVPKGRDENVRNMTFNVTRRNPDPLCRKTKEDIDRFLSSVTNIDPRIKLVSDKVTTKDQPNLMEKPWIKIETLLDQPGLAEDPEMDQYISKAKDVREVPIRQSQIKALQNHYQQYKEEFIRTKFKKEDLKPLKERDPNTNEKVYMIRQGEI